MLRYYSDDDCTKKMLSFSETLRFAENNVNESKLPRISPPPLIPAPHLAKKKLNVSSDLHHTTSLPSLNNTISWANLYSQQKDQIKMMSQSLQDANCEIECLKSSLVATNDIVSSNEEEIKRLEAKVSNSEAKSVRLKIKLDKEKAIFEEQKVKLVQLKNLIAESEKNQEKQRAEILNLETEINRLQAESIHPQQPVVLDSLADDLVDKMPEKKRRKMCHKCPNCEYSTFKANAMKIHCQEGCRSAVVTKRLSCDVCKAEFTYNRLRYHLNQYTKHSNHAKNGHQNYSPSKHREMLEKLKQAKQ